LKVDHINPRSGPKKLQMRKFREDAPSLGTNILLLLSAIQKDRDFGFDALQAVLSRLVLAIEVRLLALSSDRGARDNIVPFHEED